MAHIRRSTCLLGAAVYTILLVLAAAFYLERIAFLDMAFQCFHILRTGALQIQSGRFGAAATQFFPWAAQALGLPLKGVLLSYSLGHLLYYLVIFLLIVGRLKQWKWGLVLLLLSTAMTTHTFYWLSEMPQGLAFLILVLAWLDARQTQGPLRWWEHLLLAALLVTAFYFHPMVLYAQLFCGLFVWWSDESSAARKRLFGLATALFLTIAFIKYKVLPLDWYDAMSLERAKAFSEQWPHWLDIASNRDFLRWCRSDYYFIPALLLTNLAFYLYQRRWGKAALASLAPTAFVLLVNVPFHAGDRQFYLENLYLPLAVFVSVPFVFDALPGILPERKHWAPVAVIAAIGLLRIYGAHSGWTARLHWEQDFLKKTAAVPERKLLLTEAQAPMDTLLLSWGSAYEFLMLSALEHPDSARCLLIDEDPARFDSLRTQPDLFLGEFRNYRFKELPDHYFHLRDSSAYQYWKE